MSTRLYCPEDPHDCSFAQASRLGTWYPESGPGICAECGVSTQKRVAPLIIEWEPGSDLVGDFTWPGVGDEIVVKQRVREVLEARFRGLAFFPVEMYQHPKLKRPDKANKRSKPRVWLPYEGPTLWDLQTSVTCGIDLQRSSVSIERQCQTCRRVIFRFPRWQDRSLVIDPTTWNGEDVFRIRELPVLVVTEEVKHLIEGESFTNVRFWLVGEIPD